MGYMNQNVGPDRKQAGRDNETPDEIRVTDRRRIHLDNEGDGTTAGHAVEPSLKPSYVEELEGRAKTAEQKMLEVQSRFEQLRAQLQRETDETRQRLNRAADERAHREKAYFIAGLLPVLDNLQRAIEASESQSSIESIVHGIRTTASSFDIALEAAGVEPVASIGEIFNPEMHEAVDIVLVDPDQDGTVTAEYARGYKIGERLLRPARVQVGSISARANQIAG